MNTIISFTLSPWLSSTERAIASTHIKDNFAFVSYQKVNDSSQRVFEGVLHKPTKRVHFDDSSSLLRFKFFLITLATPWFLFKRVAYNLIRIVIDTCIIFYRALNSDKSFFFPTLKMTAWRIYEAFVRTPYYECGLFIAAIGGVISNPYTARAHYSMIELKLQHNIPRNRSFAHYINRPCVEQFSKSEAYYDGICLQPLVDDLYADKWQIISVNPV